MVPEIGLVDDPILVYVHEPEALLVHLQGSLVEVGRALSLAFSLTHAASSEISARYQ